MADIEFLNKMAAQVRRDVVRMVHNPASGHPGGSLAVPIFSLHSTLM
jgi:transketolase